MAKLKTSCHSCKEEQTVLIQAKVRVITDKDKGHRADHETYSVCEDCLVKNIKSIKDMYRSTE